MARPGYDYYIKVTNLTALAQGTQTKAQSDLNISQGIPGSVYHDYDAENYITATGLVPASGQAEAYYAKLANVDPVTGITYTTTPKPDTTIFNTPVMSLPARATHPTPLKIPNPNTKTKLLLLLGGLGIVTLLVIRKKR